ncbi:MAG: GH116 family glycosyl hydrolase [Candidatus Nanoarchaeia archaeon]|nr:GH116 family glycosyl hydrolase [Candidatus Nanoarchaeia archaeon]
MENNLEKAYEIALNSLKECHSDHGIIAGKRKFDDYWARDAFFAILGSLSVNDLSITRSTLNLFLNHQNTKGQLPRRIDRTYVSLKYAGLKIKRKNLRPRYTNSVFTAKSLDQNSLFIISLLYYIKKTRDFEYLERNFKKIKAAMDWNFLHYKGDLLHEGLFANWEDTIIKRGFTLYTNVLHYGALQAFIDLCKLVNYNYTEYEEKAKLLKQAINDKFWNGNYYKSWISKKNNIFCSAGNILAILYNVADEKKSLLIEKFIKGNIKSIPLPSSFPKYSVWRSPLTSHLRGSLNYHGGYSWLWVGSLNVLALQKLGMKKEADEQLKQIADVIVESNNVYEVYDNGKSVNKLLFKSEVPFAWSAGLFVFAYNKLNEKL